MEDNLTVAKLLHEDTLRALAEKIISEDIDNIILIYRDKREKRISWETTISEWASVFGAMEMVKRLMVEDWLEPDESEDR